MKLRKPLYAESSDLAEFILVSSSWIWWSSSPRDVWIDNGEISGCGGELSMLEFDNGTVCYVGEL